MKVVKERKEIETRLIASSRTEDQIKGKINRYFGLDVELVPVVLPKATCRREWKIEHSTGITDEYRVTTKSSKGICRFRFEKILNSRNLENIRS